MRLSFSTLACPNWSLTQILHAAVTHGIDGVDFRGLGPEIDITRLPEFDPALDTTLELFRARHIEMPCFNTSVTLVSPTPQRWQEMLEECQRYARLASQTGTSYLRIFGGKVPATLARDEAVAMARRHLRQVSKICRAHGCVPLVESHDDWATSARALDLLHEFTPDEAGVLWDIEHTVRSGERPAETTAALSRYLKHVHLKDSVRHENRNEPRLLGEGDLPLKECLAALVRTGYDGWLVLETEKRWHEDAPPPEVSIGQFADYVKRALEECRASLEVHAPGR